MFGSNFSLHAHLHLHPHSTPTFPTVSPLGSDFSGFQVIWPGLFNTDTKLQIRDKNHQLPVQPGLFGVGGLLHLFTCPGSSDLWVAKVTLGLPWLLVVWRIFSSMLKSRPVSPSTSCSSWLGAEVEREETVTYVPAFPGALTASA